MSSGGIQSPQVSAGLTKLSSTASNQQWPQAGLRHEWESCLLQRHVYFLSHSLEAARLLHPSFPSGPSLLTCVVTDPCPCVLRLDSASSLLHRALPLSLWRAAQCRDAATICCELLSSDF